MPFAHLVSHSCFSAAQIAKISLLALTVASLDNYLVLNARCNFVVWYITRQADRNGETVKHLHNCIRVLSHFVHCTNIRQYSNRPSRWAWQCTDTILTISASHFCASELCQPVIAAAVTITMCRKTCFRQIVLLQYKAKPCLLGFQNLGCHFDTPKRLKNTAFMTHSSSRLLFLWRSVLQHTIPTHPAFAPGMCRQ